MLLAVLLTLASHLILAVTLINPYVSIVTMGIGYSLLAAALWPMVALIVPVHRQGTAFGNRIRYLKPMTISLATICRRADRYHIRISAIVMFGTFCSDSAKK